MVNETHATNRRSKYHNTERTHVPSTSCSDDEATDIQDIHGQPPITLVATLPSPPFHKN